MNRIAIILFAIAAPFAVKAQTRTSIANGSATAPTTWDCGCVPNAAASLVIQHSVTLNSARTYNDVTIASGGTFLAQGAGSLTVNGNMDIKAGGTMTNNKPMTVKGDYSIAGTHSGSKPLTLSGSDKQMKGTAAGKITNASQLVISGGNKIIPAGEVFTKTKSQVRVVNVTVANNGTFSAFSFTGSGVNAKVVQGSDASLTINGTIATTIGLDASASGNTVIYANTNADQYIRKTTDQSYWHLQLTAFGTNRKKIMRSDLNVRGDLGFTNCTFDTRYLVDFNLTVKGNWTNTNAVFVPRTAMVTFNNASHAYINSTGVQNFNNLTVSGADTLELRTPVQTTNDITIGGKLDVGAANNTITVGRNWTNTGEFIHRNGNVVFNGSGDQVQAGGRTEYHDLTISKSGGNLTVSGGRQKVFDALTLTGGTFITNDSLSMSSNASGDSRIAPITGGSISGPVYVQRYIDAGVTNWRFLTAPSSGQTLLDWQDDFVTSGYPGSHWPAFPFTSIHTYDETAAGTEDDGFVAATGSNETISAGQGAWVWCGDSLNGTAPFMVDVNGPVYQGNIDLPVSYTDHGSPSGDGWCMVGNPYVSVIDWASASWTKNNINNAFYVWNPDMGNFAGYVGGLGINGGTRYIASSQAFWVQTNGSSPLLRISENCKSATATQFRNDEEPQDILRMRVIGNGASDETVLRIAPEATAGFDGDYDAYEKWSLSAGSPNICTKLPNGKNVMVNSIAQFSVDTVIPVKVKVGAQASYQIQFTSVGGAFAQSCLTLEDVVAGTNTTVSEGGSYSFTMAPSYNGTRFRLHARAPMLIDTWATSCDYTNDGQAVAHPSGTGPWTYNWSTAEGDPVQSHTDNGPDTLFNAHAGGYALTVDGQGGCGQLTANIEIPSPDPIDAQANISNAACDGSATGGIDVSVSGGTAPYDFVWSTGTTTANVQQLAPGTYFVDIHDAHGCNSSVQYEVGQDPLPEAAYSAPPQAVAGVPVSFTNSSSDLTGQVWDFGDGTTSTGISPMHTFAVAGTYNVSLTVGDSLCQDVVSMPIVIEANTTGIADNTSENGFRTEVSGDDLVLVVHNTGTHDLSVRVDNLLGQRIINDVRGTWTSGRYTVARLPRITGALLVTTIDNGSGERSLTKLVR